METIFVSEEDHSRNHTYFSLISIKQTILIETNKTFEHILADIVLIYNLK